LEQELPDSSSWKKKQCSEQFPILEHHVVEWVDRANLKRVPINDYVLKITTEKLISKLSVISQEDYTDFVVSNRWINNLKHRHNLRSKKKRGEGGDFDEKLIPGMRQELRAILDDFPLHDVFNYDELALQ